MEKIMCARLNSYIDKLSLIYPGQFHTCRISLISKDITLLPQHHWSLPYHSWPRNQTLCPTPPPTHSFRLTGSIDRQGFTKDILIFQIILNPPSSLEDLLSCYNSTLSDLLNAPAPVITKRSSDPTDLWLTSYPGKPLIGFKTFRRRLEHIYKRATDPASKAKDLVT